MKTFRLFLFLLLAFCSNFSFADWGRFQSGITINGNYHDCYYNTIAYELQHSAFGRFTSSGSLIVNSAQMWTWKDQPNSNACGATLYYRVYRTSDSAPSFSSELLNWQCNSPCAGGGANDQLWETDNSINLLSGLTLSGTYVFEIYFEYSGSSSSGSSCSEVRYDNNGSTDNYRAYFEFDNSDSFTNGDFSDPAWTSDNISNFNIVNNSTVAALTGSEPSRTRTVRLNSSYSGGGIDTTYIATQINDWGGSQEWTFWVGRNGQSLATTNQNIIWLYADDDNVESPSINGYRLQMGDNSSVDEVRFQKVVAGTVTTLATSSSGVGAGLTDYGISFRVTRSAAGLWNVYTTPLPQNSGEAATSPTAFGTAEANLTAHLFNNLNDPSSPISIADDGYFAFMVTNSSAANALTAPEFDNFHMMAFPPDTYFTFSDVSSSIDENNSGNAAIAVEIHHASITNAASVEIQLISGAANRIGGGDSNIPHAPSYSTVELNWAANDGATKYLYIDPDNNSLCDDNANLRFKLINAAGGDNAYVGADSTHVLTVLDDNMGYDTLTDDDFETDPLSSAWVSTPSGRWSRTNTDAVTSTGYSLGHNAFGSTDSSSIAISLDTMPLIGVATTWRFQVRYQQDGTANNRWLTFLSANNTDLRTISGVNGYAIGFNQTVTGGSNDSLCLFKVTNGVSTVLINTGLDWVTDIGSNDAISFEVLLDESGEWSIHIDLNGGFDNLTAYGTPTTDLVFPLMNAFGARVNFTNTASAKFRIDDVLIEQKGCKKIWYSQGTGGNSNAAIWWNAVSGGSIAVTGSRYDRFQIQSGDNVTANGLWITEDIAIESGATLTGQANTDLRLFGDWFNEGSFVRGTSNITFRGTENQNIIGPSITQFHNLTIDNDGGAVTAIDSVMVRNVAYVNEGTFNVNGKVNLFSNSTWSGSIGEIKQGGAVTGNVTLMRYIPSIPYQYGNWLNLGNPLTGLTLAAWNSTITTTGFAGSDYPAPYPFVNIRYYDESGNGTINNGYQNVTNITNTLMTDRGYFVWLDGAAQSVRPKGAIQQGSFNHSLGYTASTPTPNATADGWNLMTNPYPSEVDWHRVSSNLSGPRAYYVFDYQTNAYKYWLATGDETGSGTASRYIPHSQSFMVKVNTSGQYLTYQENFKSNNGTAFERGTGESDNSFIAIQLERNGMMDENLLFFNENSHENYDGMDAIHLASMNDNSIQLSFISGDNQALIQDTRPFNSDITISVKAKMPEAGTYNLIIPAVGNLPAGACLFVEDLVTGQTMQLVEGSEMQVTISAPFEGIRFRITGNAPAKVITTDATCFGLADGTLDVTVPSSIWSVKLNDESHDFEYVSNGSVTLDGLRAGVYQLEVINPDASCSAEIKTFTISEPAAITSAITSTEQVLCNEGLSGSISWITNNADWFSFEIKDENNNTVQNAEVEGNSYIAENLASGLYTINVYTECGTHALSADLRDDNAPIIAVNAPQTVALGNKAASVWLDATIANAQSISWTLSNGQTGQGEMFEAVLENEGVYTYTATAKGMNCETTVTGSFEVKRLVLGSGDNSSAITLLQQPEQMVLTFGAGQEGKATVRVLDANGKLVINRDVTAKEGQATVMNTSNLSIGVYTIQVIKGNDVLFTQKVFRK